MTRLPWDDLSLVEQANQILDMLDVTDEDLPAIEAVWQANEYDWTYEGRLRALADLQRIATEHMLAKVGRRPAVFDDEENTVAGQRLNARIANVRGSDARTDRQ